ncbi:hypothetical protein ASPCAL08813 [Aspergillus calidoustus]|uniref:Uncharacterized protein n=1 Tax=Aspergillus calidoustus TaxID=454130 RepID=A0A0U5GSL9_ASPCI|nr:hypothetical protein ASPCAL08813 [Aspergillus calidoustus]
MNQYFRAIFGHIDERNASLLARRSRTRATLQASVLEEQTEQQDNPQQDEADDDNAVTAQIQAEIHQRARHAIQQAEQREAEARSQREDEEFVARWIEHTYEELAGQPERHVFEAIHRSQAMADRNTLRRQDFLPEIGEVPDGSIITMLPTIFWLRIADKDALAFLTALELDQVPLVAEPDPNTKHVGHLIAGFAPVPLPKIPNAKMPLCGMRCHLKPSTQGTGYRLFDCMGRNVSYDHVLLLPQFKTVEQREEEALILLQNIVGQYAILIRDVPGHLRAYRERRWRQEKALVRACWEFGDRQQLFARICTQAHIDNLIATDYNERDVLMELTGLDINSPNLQRADRDRLAWFVGKFSTSAENLFVHQNLRWGEALPWEVLVPRHAAYSSKLYEVNRRVAAARRAVADRENAERDAQILRRQQAELNQRNWDDFIDLQSDDGDPPEQPRGRIVIPIDRDLWLFSIERHAKYRDSQKLQAQGHRASPSHHECSEFLGIGPRPEVGQQVQQQYRNAPAWRELQEAWTKVSDYDLTHGAPWGLPAKKLQEYMNLEILDWEERFIYHPQYRDVLRRIDEWYRGLPENQQQALHRKPINQWADQSDIQPPPADYVRLPGHLRVAIANLRTFNWR